MKKTYIQPATNVEIVELQAMIAGSNDSPDQLTGFSFAGDDAQTLSEEQGTGNFFAD